MARIAKQVTLTNKQQEVLTHIITSRTQRQDHVVRAKIILLSYNKKQDKQISYALDLAKSTVRKWRKQWLQNEERLLLVDEREKGLNYVRIILEILSDGPRSGAPNTFTAEQVCQIMSLACERPEDGDLPISHWSLNSLVNEIISRGIVETISRSRVASFLKSRRHQTS
jgi:transposase